MALQSISGQKGNKLNVPVLNLAESFTTQRSVLLSQFVDMVSYIPLETNPQALIGGTIYYEVTQDNIIVRQRSQTGQKILLFDRKTGKFIREIGKQGNGPGEFRLLTYIPYNPIKKALYAINSSWEILGYDLSGRNIEKINMPEIRDENGKTTSLSTIPITWGNILNNEIFVGHFMNDWGLEKNKLVFLSKGKVVKMFPNYQVLKYSTIKGGLSINRDNFTFYRWANKIYFIELYNDTLFEVTKNSLVPRFYFNFEKYNVTWSMRNMANDIRGTTFKNYFYIRDIDENKNYIFIKVLFEGEDFLGFIDKKTLQVTFCKKNSLNEYRIKDDISGLMDILPLDFTQNNEMIYVIQPLELMNWFKKNPESAALARTKLPWLTNIDEFSNPIIAIGRCKD